MTEKIIKIETSDLQDFLGVNNQRFNLIKNYKIFAALKIIERGDEIKIIGETKLISQFEERFSKILEYYNKNNSVNKDIILEILENNIQPINIEKDASILVYGNEGRQIKARTPNQKILVDLIRKNDLIFAIGPAGSGKTYISIALAVRSLKNKEVKKIILSRPAVEAGESLGFLPGDIREKLDPYMQALYDALRDMISPIKLEQYINEGTIEIAPIAYMRGRTLENAFVILDEAQNTTQNQLKMFLTRMGVNSKFIVNGDTTQIDLPNKEQSGLLQAIKLLKNIDEIKIVQFDVKDIVRHPLVRKIVEAYQN